jgi:hypothetical protein
MRPCLTGRTWPYYAGGMTRVGSISLGALLLFVGLGSATAKMPPKPPEHDHPTPEALARKKRSEARLVSQSVPVSRSLPVIESEAEAKFRARERVVDRAIALMLVAAKGEGLDQAKVIHGRDKFGAASFFSPSERAFVENPSPSQMDKTQFVWKYECLGVMLWALGYLPELSRPNAIVDAGKILGLILKPGPETFRKNARLRTPKELLDEADLIYRYDWACVEARSSGGTPPAGVECGIVVERHRALNWLIGYNGQDWDDVSTDT